METSSMKSTDNSRTINNVMRHEYKVLNDEEKVQMQKIKDMGREFHEYLESIAPQNRGESFVTRELEIAQQKVEEVVMWGVKHVTGE